MEKWYRFEFLFSFCYEYSSSSILKITVIWVVMPCISIDQYQYLRETCLPTWHHIPEDICLYRHHHHNFKFHFVCYCALYYYMNCRPFLAIGKAWSYRPESRERNRFVKTPVNPVFSAVSQ